MKRNIKYIIVFLIILSSSIIEGIAQESYLLKELRIPQVAQESPGSIIPYDAHVCFPMLGRIHVGVNLPFAPYGDLLSISDGLLDKMKKNNAIRIWEQIDPIHFGFRVNKKNYFSITTAIKTDANITFKKDLASFIIKGNVPFEGKNLSFLGNDFLSINSYAEIGIGYNREINDNVSFGVNAKYLLGLFNAHTSKAELLLYTGKNFHEINIKHSLHGKVAGIVDIEDFAVEDIAKNLKNHGFALDVGARYQINRLFEVSASVLDIGFIRWKANTKEYIVDNETFSVVGMQYEDIISDTGKGLLTNTLDPEGYLRKIADSISNTLISEITDRSAYTKWLNLRFNVGGSIYASPNDRFNFTFTGKFINGVFIPSGCVSYHRTCGKWFDFVIGNTFKTNAIFNPGLGMNLTLEVFQLYLAVDYVNSLYIDRAKNLNVALGINFVAPLKKDKLYKASYPY